MDARPDLVTSVIIPACNEEQTIGAIVREIRQLPIKHEVIVVDDGSRDRTGEVAAEAGARVLRHSTNLGNGASIKHGVREAGGEVVLLMDGDGQHDPADIPRLLAGMSDHDMVVGARTRRSRVPALRAFGNRLLTAVANLVSGTRVPDLTSGFRAIRREVLLPFLPILPNRFSYPTTITLALLKGGYPVQYVPLDSIGRRAAGSSKLRPFRDGLRVLLTIVRIVSLFSPLRVFLPVSLALGAVGLAFLGCGLAGGGGVGPAPLFLLAAVVVLCLGLLADRNAYIRRAPRDR